MNAKKIQITLTTAAVDEKYDNCNSRLKSAICRSKQNREVNIEPTVDEKLYVVEHCNNNQGEVLASAERETTASAEPKTTIATIE